MTATFDPAPPTRQQRADRSRRDNKQHRSAVAVWTDFADLVVGQDYTVVAALQAVGRQESAYIRWRQRNPEWRARFDAAREERRKHLDGDKVVEIVGQLTFAEFRTHFLKHPSPWFQLLVIDKYETLPLAHIALFLFPPNHGKTTLWEDYVTWKHCYWPEWRAGSGCETLPQANKILERVMARLEPTGPFPEIPERFGPFAPQFGDLRGERRLNQPWSGDHYNIFAKRDQDERDYNHVALGWRSAVRSTRLDHLHLDDFQSERSLNQTPQMFDTYKGDWLSRTDVFGRNTVNMTRVGEGDLAEAMKNAWDGEEFFHVIELPAIVTDPESEEQEPLWKERFTMDQLDLIRRRDPEKFDRDYMHNPRSKAAAVFKDEAIAQCCNLERKVGPPQANGAIVWLSLDPAYRPGKNFIMAADISVPDRLRILGGVEDTKFTCNEDIMERLDEQCYLYGADGRFPIEYLVIEAKNFQAGLARDERLLELAQRHGAEPIEHLTGINKYDDEIGVRSMATSFVKGEIDLPYALDPDTRDFTDMVIKQLKRWRPYKRGTELRQDAVMALWFLWIQWRMRHGFLKEPGRREQPSAWQTKGLPWQTTSTGLLVPRKWTGWQ